MVQPRKKPYMGIFGKKKAPTETVAASVASRHSNSSQTSALARNTAAEPSKSDPLLVEKCAIDDDTMLVVEHNSEKKIAIKKTSFSPTPGTRQVTPFAVDSPNDNVSEGNDAASTPDDKAPGPFFQYRNPSITSNPTDDSGFSLVQGGSLLRSPDAYVTSSLVQWKYIAEEGPVFIRVLAVLGAIAVIVTTFLPLYLDEEKFTIPYIIVAVYTVVLAMLICALDGRSFCGRNPLSCRAKLRNLITRNVSILSLVWGRAILYVFVGGLQCSQMLFISLCCGAVMIGIGLLALAVGLNASNNLANLKSSLTDDDYLHSEFTKHDSDGDGMLSPSDFARFVWSLGLEFDDIHILKAFQSIDTDYDRKIDYVEFREWWSQCAQFEDDSASNTQPSEV